MFPTLCQNQFVTMPPRPPPVYDVGAACDRALAPAVMAAATAGKKG
ncbi:hypothetical protein SAMN04244559_03199 [Magnetospirillum fulvum]|uniref:Uncharacterized protein n=1 Tax=Magnetospirillum fulvum TaxID=1082 RepID=A0A1H6JQ98_MAGFU|nr:hypothetical protein SAMN04244559_03199 [Magnetospirillum fulvum]